MAGRIFLLFPIPTRDRRKQPLARPRVRREQRRLLHRLGEWFGSATALPSWGSWRETREDRAVIDRDQSVVLVLVERSKFSARRAALRKLLESIGRRLDQEQMAILAFSADPAATVFKCKPPSQRRSASGS